MYSNGTTTTITTLNTSAITTTQQQRKCKSQRIAHASASLPPQYTLAKDNYKSVTFELSLFCLLNDYLNKIFLFFGLDFDYS